MALSRSGSLRVQEWSQCGTEEEATLRGLLFMMGRENKAGGGGGIYHSALIGSLFMGLALSRQLSRSPGAKVPL